MQGDTAGGGAAGKEGGGGASGGAKTLGLVGELLAILREEGLAVRIAPCLSPALTSSKSSRRSSLSLPRFTRQALHPCASTLVDHVS